MTVRETLRTLVPLLGTERTRQLWRAYLSSDSTEKRDFESRLTAYAAELLKDDPSCAPAGLFPCPPPQTCLGDIDLGRVKYAGKAFHLFGLRNHELLRHVGVYGSSGSGKSNAIALILDGLHQNRVPFLLIDFKRTFRGLLQEEPDLLVFTAGDADTAPFRFNPLVTPKGVSIDVWAKKVVGALSHAYCQGAGSESLLISALSDAYEEAAGEHRWPTFIDVARILEDRPAKGRKGMWMDSARRAVGSLSSGNATDVFCSESSMNLTALLDKPVILELDLLNQAEQTFLSECLLLWLIQYRMNDNDHRETLQHAVIIEEAHHLLRAPAGVGDGSEPVIHTALREARELSMSIVTATQTPSLVPTPVFANQASCIGLHSSHGADVRALSQAMLLKDDAKDELGRLPVGEAIVKVPRCPEPIQIGLDYRPIAKGTVSDCAIRQIMADRWYSSDTAATHAPPPKPRPTIPIPSPDDKNLKLPESPSAHASSSQSDVASPTTTPEDERTQVSFPEPTELELAMLRDIVEHPFEGVVQRIQRLQTSRRKGTAALKSLQQRGLIKPQNVFTGKSLVKLFDITNPAGRAFCHQHDFGPLPDITEGGIEHRYWVHHIADRLRAEGWAVKTEHRVSDDLIIDVHAEKDGKTKAVLVESGKSSARANFGAASQAGYTDVRFFFTSPGAARALDGFPHWEENPESSTRALPQLK